MWLGVCGVGVCVCVVCVWVGGCVCVCYCIFKTTVYGWSLLWLANLYVEVNVGGHMLMSL